MEVQRIAGKDRYETNANAVLETFGGQSGMTAYLVSGDAGHEGVDAITIATIAGHSPVFMTRSEGLPAVTRKALEQLRPSKVIVLGGEGAVSDAVEEELRGL